MELVKFPPSEKIGIQCLSEFAGILYVELVIVRKTFRLLRHTRFGVKRTCAVVSIVSERMQILKPASIN